jgi:hypothetical protein
MSEETEPSVARPMGRISQLQGQARDRFSSDLQEDDLKDFNASELIAVNESGIEDTKEMMQGLKEVVELFKIEREDLERKGVQEFLRTRSSGSIAKQQRQAGTTSKDDFHSSSSQPSVLLISEKESAGQRKSSLSANPVNTVLANRFHGAGGR